MAEERPLGALIESKNLAKGMKKEKLEKIGAEAKEGFDKDRDIS